ncbi:hypothetical protein BDR04DRAFT_1096612 [Suillus decipiens]|nr:hypothetical protein BDR04DRAFT_1096612 [Suillus decipiens]
MNDRIPIFRLLTGILVITFIYLEEKQRFDGSVNNYQQYLCLCGDHTNLQILHSAKSLISARLAL